MCHTAEGWYEFDDVLVSFFNSYSVNIIKK